jgi:hypothetical protein
MRSRSSTTPRTSPTKPIYPNQGKTNLKFGKAKIFRMNGKILVIGIGSFFLVFFVIESWLMRGLAH